MRILVKALVDDTVVLRVKTRRYQLDFYYNSLFFIPHPRAPSPKEREMVNYKRGLLKVAADGNKKIYYNFLLIFLSYPKVKTVVKER